MNIEEFQNASELALREKANEQFSKLETTGSGDCAAHLLTAKFYMDEVERREHDRERKHDLWVSRILELVVILLIGAEILIAIRGEIDQTHDLQKLNASVDETAKTLKSVSEAQSLLEKSLRAQEGLYQVASEQWKRQRELQNRAPIANVKLMFFDAPHKTSQRVVKFTWLLTATRIQWSSSTAFATSETLL